MVGSGEISNTLFVFEFKVGGKWSFLMYDPSGMHYENEGQFIEIIDAKKVMI